MDLTPKYNERKDLKLIENYIYLYHTDEYLILPVWPESIADSMSSTFGQNNALSRSAPVFTYSYSGPRTMTIQLDLHREALDAVNINVSNMKVEIGDDYIDTLIKKIQAIALPNYNESDKSVEPPMVAFRCGNEVFIKGIVNGGVTVTYSKPILADGRYACVAIAFTISEIDPYTADAVSELGSFRGLTKTTNIYKEAS